MKYERGDKVWWWSDVGGKKNRTKAVFLKYCDDWYPERDCILVIPIGRLKHQFRWPLRLIEPAH